MNKSLTIIFAVLALAACGNATQATSSNSADSTQSTAEATADVEKEDVEEKSAISPFTIKGITDALDGYNFDPKEHVYILHDIDGDGQKEMFIKERIREYNNYFVLNVQDGKTNLIASRMSGGMEFYNFYDDGYFVHIQESTGGTCETNYKLVKSKVVAVSQYVHECDWSGWEEGGEEPQSYESWTVNNKEVKESEYKKYTPKSYGISLYDMDDWEELVPYSTKEDSKPAVEQLKKEGRLVNELVPSTWKNTQYAKGDLNKDGRQDLVILSLPNNRENIMTRHDGYEINMNEPVIAVYLRNEYGVYELWKTSTSIIPPMNEFMSIENMSVEIKSNGVLWIKFSDFHSAGTADVNTFTKLYRAQDGGFYLIGAEEKSVSRYTQDEITESINYLTCKKIIHIKLAKGKSPKDEEFALNKEPLRSFEEGACYY